MSTAGEKVKGMANRFRVFRYIKKVMSEEERLPIRLSQTPTKCREC